MTMAAPKTSGRARRLANLRPLRSDPERHVLGLAVGEVVGLAAIRGGKNPQVMTTDFLLAPFLIESWVDWLPRSQDLAVHLAHRVKDFLDFYSTDKVAVVLAGMGPELARPQVKAVVGLLIAHLSGTRLVTVAPADALRALNDNPRAGSHAAELAVKNFDQGAWRLKGARPAEREAMVLAIGAAVAGYSRMPSEKARA